MSAPTFRKAAATLAAAFHEGALFPYVEPDQLRRARRLPWLFGGTLLHCRRYGQVHASADADAVAGWVPGERVALTPADLVQSGLIATPARLGPAQTLRLERHERASEPRLLAHVDETTAYLWVLGAAPEAQGAGHGGAILCTALEAMAASGFSRCVLRTDDEPNLGFYRHHGFEVVEELSGLPSGLPAWILARPLAG